MRPYCKLEAEKPKTTFPRHLSTSGFPDDLATLAVCKKKWRKKCLNPVLGYVLSYDRKFGDESERWEFEALLGYRILWDVGNFLTFSASRGYNDNPSLGKLP